LLDVVASESFISHEEDSVIETLNQISKSR